jgi:hypothetical protein
MLSDSLVKYPYHQFALAYCEVCGLKLPIDEPKGRAHSVKTDIPGICFGFL